MPRLPPAQPPFSTEIQTWLDRMMPPGVPPLALFTTLARDPRLFGRFMAGGLLDRGHLTMRARELTILRTTARSGSEYEWGVHVAVFGPRIGLTDGERHAIVHGDDDDACWSDGERAIIRLCDALHATCTVDDALWSELRAHHDELAIVELLMLAGSYRMVSYLTNALALPREAFAPGFSAAAGARR